MVLKCSRKSHWNQKQEQLWQTHLIDWENIHCPVLVGESLFPMEDPVEATCNSAWESSDFLCKSYFPCSRLITNGQKTLVFQLRFPDKIVFLFSPFIVILTIMWFQGCNSHSVNHNPKLYNCFIFRNVGLYSQILSYLPEFMALLIRKQEWYFT